MNASDLSPATVRDYVTTARGAIDQIEATGLPIPSHLAGEYARACDTVEQLEQLLGSHDLGLVWFLAIPLVASMLAGTYVLYKVSDELVGSTRQVVRSTGNALSWAVYGLVGLLVYDFAKKRRAA